MKFLILICALMAVCLLSSWGFFAHKVIHETAVYLLPPELAGFYKPRLTTLILKSVAPDQRRYQVPEEGARHYIDLDHYSHRLPTTWDSALRIYPKDTLLAHGIVPWQIMKQYNQLRDAFFRRDQSEIIRLSAEIGHYASDACVPLHTTSNYNGQKTNQHGIHGLWESRLPELFLDSYNLYFDTLDYLKNPQLAAWHEIVLAHRAVDSVLTIDRHLAAETGRTYSFEHRQKTSIKAVSRSYSREYHQALNNMVERQLRRAIRFTASLWYSAWVDAGQPQLDGTTEIRPDTVSDFTVAKWKTGTLKPRCDQ